MSPLRVLLATHVLAIRGAWGRQTRTRVSSALFLLLGSLAGFVVAPRLADYLRGWREAGRDVFEVRVWLLLLGAWGGIAAVAALTTLKEGLTDDGAVLLQTLPVPPDARFRALYLLTLTARRGLPEVTLTLTAAVALATVAPRWVLPLLVGAIAAVAGGIVLALLAVSHPPSSAPRSWRAALVVVLALPLVALGAPGFGLDPADVAPPPGPVALVMGLLLVAALGPGAGRFGELLSEACQCLQERSAAPRARMLPGVQVLTRALAGRRSPTGAMLVKESLDQSRDGLHWLRLVVPTASLLAIPWLHGRIAPYHLSPTFLAVAFAIVPTIYGAIDFVPSPIGGEGNRLTLYLTAPVPLSGLLRAKLIAVLVPMLIQGSFLSLAAGWWLGLDRSRLLMAGAAVAIMAAGATATLTWGSAWDEDLDLPVEGAVQTLLHEHVPITRRRIWLINLVVILIAAQLWLLWRVRLQEALPGLVALNAAIAAGAWRFGGRCLRALLAR